ncbi:hypothetical protein V6N12_028386 [Hibiscus sabdariffa]|uniref:Reverse transcriptase n=1 Tax=Hibiscus sabdariffa TaxID=183260 RepID=A0ABR2F5N8_9ROSI
MLKDCEGDWCSDDASLKDAAVKFFSKLFECPDSLSGTYPYRGLFPAINPELLCTLDLVPSFDEIKEALFDMSPLKSPYQDGLHAHFFQINWNFVGPSVCDMIRSIFNGAELDLVLNRTSLVLILKIDHPQSFADFRPISLCSVLYKLLTKVIVRRLQHIMPILISPT